MRAPQQGGRQPYAKGIERRAPVQGFPVCKKARPAQTAVPWPLCGGCWHAMLFKLGQVRLSARRMPSALQAHACPALYITSSLADCLSLQVLLMLRKHGRHC